MEAYRQRQREFDDWIGECTELGSKEFEACALQRPTGPGEKNPECLFRLG